MIGVKHLAIVWFPQRPQPRDTNRLKLQTGTEDLFMHLIDEQHVISEKSEKRNSQIEVCFRPRQLIHFSCLLKQRRGVSLCLKSNKLPNRGMVETEVQLTIWQEGSFS